MADSVQPTVTKLQSLIEGFFWILPNLGIALLIFALFLGAAWTAKWSVASIANRRDRADLGILLGSFVRADEIKSGDFEGTVERVEARATLIRTYDGQRVMIPNTDIYTRAVLVRTAFDKRRSEYDVGIG